METSDVLSLVEDMSSNIDDLEESLAPLLKHAFSASTSKLPLLDKAKLYVLATYAIESIFFSALRLNDVDAKSHPVFQELNRVKEYFAKIKRAETAGTKRSTTVDKDAAGRFIKHGLAGNDKYDRERAERVGRERAGAKRRLEDMSTGTHTRFDGAAKRMRASEVAVPVVQAADLDDEAPAEPVAAELVTLERRKKAKNPGKRDRRLNTALSQLTTGEEATKAGEDLSEEDGGEEAGVQVVAEADSAALSPCAPRSQNEAFQALQQGSLTQAEGKKSKKRKRKSRGEAQRDLEDARAAEMK